MGDHATDDTLLRAVAAAPATTPPRADLSFGPGSRVKQYELIRELGRGGMGRVFLARDTRLGRRVAMKFLSGDAPDFTERVLAEARATVRCSHENIIVLHEADEDRGRPYLVLEYLEGEPLSMVISRRPPVGQIVELVVPVVRALVRAHEFGIVHRDLKPENIFVTHAGTVKVLDFGIAKLFVPSELSTRDSAAPEIGATRESMPAGTIPYMAPEQLRGDVDGRTDVWAVGVILHELATGRHPLGDASSAALLDHLTDLARPMPRARDAGAAEELAAIIDRCLAKQKTERHASARELLEALEPLLPRRWASSLPQDASPYPGLAPFEEADTDRFFGRSQDVSRLVSRLRDQPMTALVAPSGAGKSSLVRAGVIPALKAQGAWEILVLRPGRRPFAALAGLLAQLTGAAKGAPEAVLAERLAGEPGALGAILRGRASERGTNILLFVDQFEELYPLVPEAAERMAFTACLSAMADDAAAPLRLLLSMRSDFLDRAAEDRPFADQMARGIVLLSPLGEQGLREALVAPLEQTAHRFESTDLVSEMLRALASSSGALPLLQFAASKLWEGRDRERRVLTRATYEEIGGLTGALAAHADEVVAGLLPSGQRLARAVLTRLVTPEGTRDAVTVAELEQLSADASEVRTLIDHLSRLRLLVVQSRGEDEGAAVELIHESLIAGWPTLRRWLDEGREDAAFLAELRAAARQWEGKGRPAGLLWRAEAAEEARHFSARFRGELAARESSFLAALLALHSRAARLRRIAIGGTIGLLLALVAAGSVALVSIRAAKVDAVEQAARAGREATRARDAEQHIKDQLAVIEAEQRAKEKARAEVVEGKEQLRQVNGELERALGKAQAESSRARDEATHAQGLADSLKVANTQLEKLLASERARTERLEQERKKINTKLR